jgi:hypothetical protein
MYRSTFFLTSVLVGGERSASRPGRFNPRETASDTHWIRGWVGPRAGLDDMEKRKILTLLELELRPFGRPVPNQSLYCSLWISRIAIAILQTMIFVSFRSWIFLSHLFRLKINIRNYGLF